jgi:hypothetical protein
MVAEPLAPTVAFPTVLPPTMIETSAEIALVFFIVIDHVGSAAAPPVPTAVATASAPANVAAAMARSFRYRLNIVSSFQRRVFGYFVARSNDRVHFERKAGPQP